MSYGTDPQDHRLEAGRIEARRKLAEGGLDALIDESRIREEIRRQSVRYARATLTDDDLYAEVTLEVLSFWHGYLEVVQATNRALRRSNSEEDTSYGARRPAPSRVRRWLRWPGKL